MVNVEVDGEQHAESRAADAERDDILAAYGVMTIRIRSLDLFEPTSARFSYWLKEIKRHCEERAGRRVGRTELA